MQPQRSGLSNCSRGESELARLDPHEPRFAPPEDRVAGALLGLFSVEKPVALSANRPRPHHTALLALLDSLEANGRFHLADVTSRMQSSNVDHAEGMEIVARCLPLALWMRGPDERIALAAVRLSEVLEADAFTGLGCAFGCQWLRNLYTRRTPQVAWQKTLQDLANITAFLGTDGTLLTTFRDSLESPALALMHPVTHALRQTADALEASTSLQDMMDRLHKAGCDTATLAMGGCVAGMHFGYRQTAARWPASTHTPKINEWAISLGQRASLMYRLNAWPPETSQTHPLPIATIPLDNHSRVGVCPAPGRQGFDSVNATVRRDLELDVARISQWQPAHLVCLLPADTLLDCGMAGLAPALEAEGITFWHLPQPSDPSDRWFHDECNRVVPKLATALQAGQSVLIHGLDLDDDSSAAFAARLLTASQPGTTIEEAALQVKTAIAATGIDFSLCDQDA